MENYKYIVEISMEDKRLRGKLQETKKVNKITTIDKNIKIDDTTQVGEIINTDKKLIVLKNQQKLINYNFVPNSVLCDLSVFENINNEVDKDNTNTDYIYEKSFDIPIKINKHKDTYYYIFTKLIAERIINNKPIKFKELEKLKLYFDISLDYSISYKEKSKTIKKDFDYVPLQCGFCNIEKVFENNDKKSHKYIYKCNTLTDVIFAILHYLVINKYNKIKKCNHCGKLFFYNNERSKYCNRKSPYTLYNKKNKLECEQTVRNVKQNFSIKHKRRYNENRICERSLNEYLDVYYFHKDKIDNCSSIENLEEMRKFLYKEKN